MSSNGGRGGDNTTPASKTISAAKVGAFSAVMSTSFQPAEWSDQFFLLNPSAITRLRKLGPHHVRWQGLSQGFPQTSTGTWDLSILDDIAQPAAPGFMYDSHHNLDFQHFPAYTQNLVRCYNVPAGFSALDGQQASPSGLPITGWGIYNEPNFNNLDSTAYTQLYNTVVPRMQAVDPSLKYVPVDLGDHSGLASQFLPAFVAQVTAPVNVLATHFYSTCNQQDTDAKLIATVPGFVSVANHAVNNPATDNNGPGVPFKLTANGSALGAFTSASRLLIDKDTSAANGPVAMPMTPAAKIAFELNGYSVGIHTLEP